MGQRDQRIDRYIADSAEFARPVLEYLREVVHQGCPEVEETWKWSFPHFMHHGILCSMAAFKAHCTFGFWKGQLVLAAANAAPGKGGEAMGQFGRITSLDDLPKKSVLLRLIREAARLNREGIKKPTVPKPTIKRTLVVPDYFATLLKQNPRARDTFEGFSHSHKKEYLEWITEAKTEPTRQKRLATTLEWLAEGKARHWKYQNCG